MFKKTLLAIAAIVGLGSSAAFATGMTDLTSNGRVVAWTTPNPNKAFILTPGQAPKLICTASAGSTFSFASAGLELYNGSYVMFGWLLDTAGHYHFFDEVSGCSDKGIL
jgi:hypothetical protein